MEKRKKKKKKRKKKKRSILSARPGNLGSRAVFGPARLRHDTISINTNTTRLINGPGA